jgi:phospholipase C
MPPIDHVVVLMMENACFDRMLGALAETHPGLDGVDPAHPRSNPDGPHGRPVLQGPTTSRNIDRDPRHYLYNSLAQLDGGTNNGFVADFVRTHPRSTEEERREVMGYYPRGFLPALHTLAENFVVCDRWFSSLPGPTWINRLFAHSGTSLGHVSEPGGLFSNKLHLYTERTLYDELSDAAVEWRIYYGSVPQSLVMTHQWTHLDRYRSYRHWADDVAKGDLPAYTFIEPSYFGPHQNDQHPPHDVMRGDKLIADTYNALRANPDLFARTVLFVLYDEHGGFYDHVPPPAAVPPDEHTAHFAFDVLGFRVPAVIISPLLDPGVVHTVFDHTSLLRMAANKWPDVQPLGRRAAQANDPLAAVRWRQAPRTDLPEAPVAPDIQPARSLLTLGGFAASLYGLSSHLESRLAHPGKRAGLMARMHEALEGPEAQAALAADRVAAFLEHGAEDGEGLLARVGHAVKAAAEKVGL